MKNFEIFLCFFLLVFCAYGQNEGTIAERESNASLTAKLLVNEIKIKVKSLKSDPVAIESEISKDLSVHQNKAASKEAVKKMLEKNYEAWYQAEVNKVLERIDEEKPDSVSTWFNKQTRDKLLAVPKAEIESNLDSNLNSDFNQARNQAVSKQWGRLTVNIYPTEAEVDANTAESLKNILELRIVSSQKETLFEENKSQISNDIVNPFVEDAYSQREMQKEIVAKADGGTEIIPELVEKDIERQLAVSNESLTKSRLAQTSGSTKVYGVFPSIRTSITETAKKIALNKFANYLSQITMSFKKEDVKDVILRDLAKHIVPDESRKILEQANTANISKLALDTYVKKAPEEKQAALNEFATECINNDQTCKTNLENLVKRSLDLVFNDARKEIATEQLAEFFAPLANGTWVPESSEINQRSDSQVIGDIDLLTLKGLTSKTVDVSKLLTESKLLAEEKAKKLLEEGLNAFHQQMASVNNVENFLTEEIKKIAELPSDADFIKQFTDAVKADWQKQTLASKYPDLFEKVVKEAEVRAKALLPREATRRQNEAEEKKIIEEAKNYSVSNEKSADSGGQGEMLDNDSDKGSDSSGGGGGGTGGGTGSGGGDKEEPPKETFVPDMIIDLDITSPGNVSADIYLVDGNSGEIRTVKIPIVGDVTQEQTKQISSLFSEMFVREIKEKYYVYMRVFSRQISYGVVYDFRECLEKVIDQITILEQDRKFSVKWFDQLMKQKSEKGKTEVPKDIEFKGQDYSHIA